MRKENRKEAPNRHLWTDLLMNRLLFEHLPLSLLIGCLGCLSGGNWLCLQFALAVGWCIDVDHLFDFFYYLSQHHGKPDWSLIRSGGYFSINGKIFVPLHSWELTFITVLGLGFFTQNWILALTTGAAHTAHLLQDMRAYKVRLLGYSLISRAFRSFEQRGFCTTKVHFEHSGVGEPS